MFWSKVDRMDSVNITLRPSSLLFILSSLHSVPAPYYSYYHHFRKLFVFWVLDITLVVIVVVWRLAKNHQPCTVLTAHGWWEQIFTSCCLIFRCTFFVYWINYLMNALLFYDSAKFCYIKTHFWSYQSLRFYAYWSLFSS